jgi:hypothetical protein
MYQTIGSDLIHQQEGHLDRCALVVPALAPEIENGNTLAERENVDNVPSQIADDVVPGTKGRYCVAALEGASRKPSMIDRHEIVTPPDARIPEHLGPWPEHFGHGVSSLATFWWQLVVGMQLDEARQRRRKMSGSEPLEA